MAVAAGKEYVMRRCGIRGGRTMAVPRSIDTGFLSQEGRGRKEVNRSHGKGHVCLSSWKTAGEPRTKDQVFVGNIS